MNVGDSRCPRAALPHGACQAATDGVGSAGQATLLDAQLATGQSLVPAPPPGLPEAVFRAAGVLAAGMAIMPCGSIPSIPDHELLEPLGRGAMGVVFKARHLRLERLVALKVIPKGPTADPRVLARFRSESQLAARLQHPNIAQVFEVGETADCAYLSMELLSGGTLARRSAARLCDQREAADIVETLARAVQHAHEHGVIHRDLKPANVLLSESAAPKIVDFGLAKLADAAEGHVHHGDAVGTPHYMAPEQAHGESGPACDVYALGAILYELCTGAPPFRGAAPFDVLHRVLHEEPLRPSRLRRDLAGDLETICLTCLCKLPAGRYPSASALADDLARYRCGRPIVARPVRPLERLSKWARRNPLVAVLTAATMVGLAGFVVTWAVLTSRWRQERDRAMERESAAVHLGAALREESAAAKWNLYVSRTANALAEWQQGRPSHAVAALDPYRDAIQEADPRGFEWYYLWNLTHARQRSIVAAGPCRAMRHSFSGDLIASGSANGYLEIWDRASGRRLGSVDAGAAVVSIAWSRDGQRLVAACGDGTLRGYQLAEELPERWSLAVPGVTCVAADPLGARFASADDSGGISLRDMDTGAELARLAGLPAAAGCVAFEHQGRQVAALASDGTLIVFDLATGAALHRLNVGGGPAMALAYNPAGDFLAVAGRGVVTLVDPAKGEVVQKWFDHVGTVWAVGFSGDGRLLASAGWDRAVHVVDVASRRRVNALRGHAGRIRSLEFVPGETGRIVTAGEEGALRYWDATAQQGSRVWDDHHSQLKAVVYSPDGRWLASASANGTIHVREAETGLPLTTFSHGAGLCGLCFLQRGSEVAVASVDGSIQIWELNGRRVGGFSLSDEVSAIAADRIGSRLAAAGRDGRVRVFEAGTCGLLAELEGPGGRLESLAFSPDDAWLAAGGDANFVRVWHASTGQHECDLPHSLGIVRAVAFSNHGQWLAAGGDSGSTDAWNTADWQRSCTLHGHDRPVLCVAFTADDRRIATGSDDCAIKLWDIATGSEVLSLTGHTGGLRGLAFRPGGLALASGSYDRTVRIWQAASASALKDSHL